jgi:hypothetical protein
MIFGFYSASWLASYSVIATASSISANSAFAQADAQKKAAAYQAMIEDNNSVIDSYCTRQEFTTINAIDETDIEKLEARQASVTYEQHEIVLLESTKQIEDNL